MKELAVMITKSQKEGQEKIEFKLDTIYIERATIRLTPKENGISMNMLCTLFRQHIISWRKQLPSEYTIEKRQNQLITYYLNWHQRIPQHQLIL